jgi:hypothetical protein
MKAWADLDVGEDAAQILLDGGEGNVAQATFAGLPRKAPGKRHEKDMRSAELYGFFHEPSHAVGGFQDGDHEGDRCRRLSRPLPYFQYFHHDALALNFHESASR